LYFVEDFKLLIYNLKTGESAVVRYENQSTLRRIHEADSISSLNDQRH